MEPYCLDWQRSISDRRKWDAAQEQCDAALIRFQQTSDLINRADALLIRGVVHRSKDELDEALTDFEDALKLIINNADPWVSRIPVLPVAPLHSWRNQRDRAHEEQEKAIIQVERVMHTIESPSRWGTSLAPVCRTICPDMYHPHTTPA